MTGQNVPVAEAPPAVSLCARASLQTLKNRADFLKAARAKRSGQPGFLLQARNRRDDDPVIRVGFTCSKKVGNAVARNRAKRRLRALAQIVLPEVGHTGHDYVLIGKAIDTAARDFKLMQDDLRRAIAKVHA